MIKQKLFLDIDDTVLKTRSNLYKGLREREKELIDAVGDDCLYVAWEGYPELVPNDMREYFYDYSKIPFKEGAEDAIESLKEKFNVILCSVSNTEKEIASKERFAASLGLPLISPLFSVDPRKAGIDMAGSVFIDDKAINLEHSNAERKILFRDAFSGDWDGEIADDWGDVLDMLL